MAEFRKTGISYISNTIINNVMKSIKLNEVLTAISQYAENPQGKKPMIFWFHSNPDLDDIKQVINSTPSYSTFIGHPLKQGNQYMFLNGNTVKIANHPELVDAFVLPTTKNDSTKLFIYHKYIQQLDAEALQYCMDIVTIGQYPVVCLMNDYSLKTGKPSEELLSFVSESFEQYNVNQ